MIEGGRGFVNSLQCNHGIFIQTLLLFNDDNFLFKKKNYKKNCSNFCGFVLCFFSTRFCDQEDCLNVSYVLQKLSRCGSFYASLLLFHNVPYVLIMMHLVMKNGSYIFLEKK